MNKQSKAPLGASLVVLSSFFYASYGIWTKLIGNFMGGYTVAAFRSAFVLVVLFLFAWVNKSLEPINWRRNWRYLFAFFLTSLIIWGPLYYAILHAGIGISFAINYASVVLGMFFFGWLLVGEVLTKDKWISAILGIVGLVLVFSPSVSHLGWLALLGALISGLAVSAGNVIAKKIRYNTTQSTIAVWAPGLIGSILMAVVVQEHFPSIGRHVEWLYLGIFALTSVIASWAFVAGVKRIEASAAGILGLLEIVFGVFFGIAFFHERPSVLAIIGISVIILAAAIPYMRGYNTRSGSLNSSA